MNWWQWILVILSTGVFVATIKVAISFDLNAWMERRDRRRVGKAQMACPHTHYVIEDGERLFRSDIISPVGTTQGVCQRCQAVFVGGAAEGRRFQEAFAADPRLYIEREKKFAKLVAKLP